MLSYAAFFFFLGGLALATTALALDRRSPVNRAMAAASVLYSIWCFCFIFVYAASRPATVMTFYKLSFVGAYGIAPAVIWLYLVLAGKSARFYRWVVAALALFTAFVLWVCFRTNFPMVAFTPGPFGNVGVPAESDFWGTLIFYLFVAVQIYAVVEVLRTRARHTSRRLRRLLAIIVITYFASVVVSVAALTAQRALSLPPLGVLASGPLVFVNFYLIASHRYLRNRDPAIESDLLSAIAQPVFFLDEDRTILGMNEAAARQFEGVPTKIVGSDLASLVDDPEAVRSEWESARLRRTSSAAVPCQMGGLSVSVRLTPHYDRFRDLTGAVAVIEKVAHLDEAAARYYISRREKEIIAMLRHGYRNKEIADRLFVTVGTVKNHLVHIFQKTGVSNRVKLSALFAEHDGTDAAVGEPPLHPGSAEPPARPAGPF